MTMTKAEKRKLAEKMLKKIGEYTDEEIAEILRHAFDKKKGQGQPVSNDRP